VVIRGEPGFAIPSVFIKVFIAVQVFFFTCSLQKDFNTQKKSPKQEVTLYEEKGKIDKIV
jgi:hypothetical protein